MIVLQLTLLLFFEYANADDSYAEYNVPNYNIDGSYGVKQEPYMDLQPIPVEPYKTHDTMGPSQIASSCLARIRLAASFDHSITFQINRYIDAMLIDRLRSFVCEKTAFFCSEEEQRAVGDMFNQFDKSIEIIDTVRRQLSSTEKDQLNMMENLNDTLAEQSFYIYKFHLLNPMDLAVLVAAKQSLTKYLSENEPDPQLSAAMGTFTAQDLARLQGMSPSTLIDDVRQHLARCRITEEHIIQDTVAFLQSLRLSNPN
ncbi:unnamed protein product [Caenorhabditis bovis]|uniref:Uncharacterized protein n=1 Tax=Caenorhabditis bovis TaxID=2654633 RepID=A0A8S1ES05_9PELO|nr:unnamed protein product [Caenorhabditis bovis]